MNKLHRSRYINVVVSMMMAFLMLAAMGTTQYMQHNIQRERLILPN